MDTILKEFDLEKFASEISQYKCDKSGFFQKIKNAKAEFIEMFPLENLDTMNISKYILQKTMHPNNYDKTFIYQLERGKNIGGGIGGGNASKSYIYMDATGKYCTGCGSKKKYLNDEECIYEYKKLMTSLKKAIEFANQGKFDEVMNLNIPIWNGLLLKIISIYESDKFIDVYSSSKLVEFANLLGIEVEDDNFIKLNYLIANKIKKIKEFKELDLSTITECIYMKIDNETRRPVYWSLGHNYEGKDMLPYFIEKSKIAIKYFNNDLSDVIGDREDLEEFLREENQDANTIRSLKDFATLKKGDIVFLKTSYTRGENGKETIYRVDAIAKVLEDSKEFYEFDEEIGHSVCVEFLSEKPTEIKGINYLRPISKISNKEVLDKIIFQLKVNNETTKETAQSETYEINENFNLNEDSKNFILYGPPGTGKTYNVIDKALKIIDKELYNEISDDREKVLNRYKQLVSEGQIEFCTFHQSYGYEEFVEGLQSDGNGNFIPSDGVLKEISYKAAFEGLKNELKVETKNYNDKKSLVKKHINDEKAFKESKKFVLIIDEINRGNISKIFGELITLLEEDKRIGTSNHITVNLPYTKEQFSIPSNLYIIGTMNTSDKSIAQIDIALRRRFSFEEMMPVYDNLGEIEGIELDKLLECINKRVEFLIDRDHLIGHAYFSRIKDQDELINSFENKIIPLLQEYFYNDNEKVGMILGGIGSSSNDEYIVYKEIISSKDIFKNFKNIQELGDKEVFKINKNITLDRIRSIYE